MPSCARSEVVLDGVVGIYHCVSRCVRRAWLCGRDPYTGKNFDHRKEWIRVRLKELAATFAIEIIDYAVLENHIHLLVRTRPDLATKWSSHQVCSRWNQVMDNQRNFTTGQPSTVSAPILPVEDAERVAELRKRLSSLSWFMRCLAEPIARRANKEDDVTGRFWEGRFRCQALLDDAAVLACSIYVALNRVRAGACDRPENSDYTSIQDRIRSVSHRANGKPSEDDPANWISPVELTDSNRNSESSVHRASDRGFLPMNELRYLQLVDWTGRHVQRRGTAAIPPRLRPLLERIPVKQEAWIDTIRHFGQSFGLMIGGVAALAREAACRGKSWYQGTRACERAFG